MKFKEFQALTREQQKQYWESQKKKAAKRPTA